MGLRVRVGADASRYADRRIAVMARLAIVNPCSSSACREALVWPSRHSRSLP